MKAEAIKYKTEFFRYRKTNRRRPTHVTATLTGASVPLTARDNDASPLALIAEGGGVDERIYNTDRGHLIALEFGGPDVPENQVPMWGRFNQSGAWRNSERKLVELVGTGTAHLHIECTYAPSGHHNDADLMQWVDPRIPIKFKITLELPDNPHSKFIQIINHARPKPFNEATVPELAQKFAEFHTEMNKIFPSGYWIEDYIPGASGVGLRVPGKTFEERPCMLLDFMAASKGFDGFDLSSVVDNSREFTGIQKTIMLAYNRWKNGGWLASDFELDFGYWPTGPSDPQEFMRHRLADVPASATTAGPPVRVLGMKGGDQAPEVDHIIPLSMGGSNCFSNAQVVSRAYNNFKRASISDTDRERIYQTVRRSLRNKE